MVIQLCKQLVVRPTIGHVPGIALRCFRDKDVTDWLKLRETTFTGVHPSVRPWSSLEFRSEIFDKRWWNRERMWVAETAQSGPHNRRDLVGSVVLGMRGPAEREQPVVHWLMVAPQRRRQGIGRLLLSQLEQACWDLGYRSVSLETHRNWSAAVSCYESLGYRENPRERPSPT